MMNASIRKKEELKDDLDCGCTIRMMEGMERKDGDNVTELVHHASVFRQRIYSVEIKVTFVVMSNRLVRMRCCMDDSSTLLKSKRHAYGMLGRVINHSSLAIADFFACSSWMVRQDGASLIPLASISCSHCQTSMNQNVELA